MSRASFMPMKRPGNAMTGEPGRNAPSIRQPHLTVEFVRRTDLWSGGGIGEEALRRAAIAAFAKAGEGAARDVTLVLACDDEIRDLNRKWAGKDRATDVLSFPAEEGEPSLGDIVLGYETVARDAAEAGISLTAHASHLIIHGILHLLGYDHSNNTGAAEMEALETEILAGLGLHDPYSEPAPQRALGQ